MQKLPRQEALTINPVFSNHLMILQDDKYNPAHYPVEEGDEVFLEDEGVTVSLSKEEADQINAEDRAFYSSTKDHYQLDDNLVWAAGAKYISSKKEPSTYLNDLCSIFSNFLNFYSNQKLIVMGDWPTPWLTDKGDLPKMQNAFKYFKGFCKPTFNGGFIIDSLEISSFIPQLFWLTRGGNALPDFLMAFEKGQTIFSICNHGVLHLESYDTTEYKKLTETLANSNFVAVEKCKDYINF